MQSEVYGRRAAARNEPNRTARTRRRRLFRGWVAGGIVSFFAIVAFAIYGIATEGTPSLAGIVAFVAAVGLFGGGAAGLIAYSQKLKRAGRQ